MLTDAAVNQAFNASDDSPFTWSKFWPLLANWYSLDYTRPDAKCMYQDFSLPYDPPPRGYGPPGNVRFKFRLTEWAKKLEVREAWKVITKQNDLTIKELHDTDRVFGFADFALSVSWSGANLR